MTAKSDPSLPGYSLGLSKAAQAPPSSTSRPFCQSRLHDVTINSPCDAVSEPLAADEWDSPLLRRLHLNVAL